MKRDELRTFFASLATSFLISVFAIVIFNAFIVQPRINRLQKQVRALTDFSNLNSRRIDAHAVSLNRHESAIIALAESVHETAQANEDLADTVSQNAEVTNENAETANDNAEIENYNASLR